LGAGVSWVAEAILAVEGALDDGDSLGLDSTRVVGDSLAAEATTLGVGESLGLEAVLAGGGALDAGDSLVTEATTLGGGVVSLTATVSFTTGVSLVAGAGGGVTTASTGRSGSTGSNPGEGP